MERTQARRQTARKSPTAADRLRFATEASKVGDSDPELPRLSYLRSILYYMDMLNGICGYSILDGGGDILFSGNLVMGGFGPSIQLRNGLLSLRICNPGDSAKFMVAINPLDDDSSPSLRSVIVGYLSTDSHKGFRLDMLRAFQANDHPMDEAVALGFDNEDTMETQSSLLDSLTVFLEEKETERKRSGSDNVRGLVTKSRMANASDKALQQSPATPLVSPAFTPSTALPASQNLHSEETSRPPKHSKSPAPKLTRLPKYLGKLARIPTQEMRKTLQWMIIQKYPQHNLQEKKNIISELGINPFIFTNALPPILRALQNMQLVYNEKSTIVYHHSLAAWLDPDWDGSINKDILSTAPTRPIRLSRAAKLLKDHATSRTQLRSFAPPQEKKRKEGANAPSTNTKKPKVAAKPSSTVKSLIVRLKVTPFQQTRQGAIGSFDSSFTDESLNFPANASSLGFGTSERETRPLSSLATENGYSGTGGGSMRSSANMPKTDSTAIKPDVNTAVLQNPSEQDFPARAAWRKLLHQRPEIKKQWQDMIDNHEMLRDDIVHFLSCSEKCSSDILVLNPLYIKMGDTATLAQHAARFLRYRLLILPLHHPEAIHFSLVVVDVVAQSMTHFDSISSEARFEETKRHVLPWMASIFAGVEAPSMKLSATRAECFQQSDGVSCGLIVATWARTISENREIPCTFNIDQLRADALDQLGRITPDIELASCSKAKNTHVVALGPDEKVALAPKSESAANLETLRHIQGQLAQLLCLSGLH
ncbi:hypothetical protein IFR05_017073 [Cadophora sp. M221]|nr:hypothetical protein IFR05_017073 [Cadophora sp. M221]